MGSEKGLDKEVESTLDESETGTALTKESLETVRPQDDLDIEAQGVRPPSPFLPYTSSSR